MINFRLSQLPAPSTRLLSRQQILDCVDTSTIVSTAATCAGLTVNAALAYLSSNQIGFCSEVQWSSAPFTATANSPPIRSCSLCAEIGTSPVKADYNYIEDAATNTKVDIIKEAVRCSLNSRLHQRAQSVLDMIDHMMMLKESL